MGRKRRPRELFVSHSSRNRRFVKAFIEILRRHRIRSWYSEHHIIGAKQWHDEIGRALRRCDWFLVVLSPDAVRSTWVKRELMYALQRDAFQERIVPVLIKSCDLDRLSWTLAAVETIDFRGDQLSGFRRLLRIWGIPFDGVISRESSGARRRARRRSRA